MPVLDASGVICDRWIAYRIVGLDDAVLMLGNILFADRFSEIDEIRFCIALIHEKEDVDKVNARIACIVR